MADLLVKLQVGGTCLRDGQKVNESNPLQQLDNPGLNWSQLKELLNSCSF